VKYDFVVIGAGASGITTAIVLAKNGYRVALVEKSKKTAPVLRGFTRNGLSFDTGFHYTGGLGEGQILDIFFRYLGVDDQVEKEPYDEECFDLIRFLKPQFEFRFPYGYEKIKNRFHETFPEDKSAVDHYLDAVRQSCVSRPYLNLDAQMHPLEIIKNLHGPSLKETLDGLTGNRLLKHILSIHCCLHGVPPEQVSFVNHARVVGGYFESVHGIKGGGRSLVRALDAQLEKVGVDVFCGQRVTQIQFSADGAVSGVRLENHSTLRAKACVCTVHPRILVDFVPHSLFRPTYIRRLLSLEETGSVHILFGKCASPLQNLSGCNMFLIPGLDYPILKEDGSISERSLFMTCTSQIDGAFSGKGFIAICPSSAAEMERWWKSETGKRPQEYLVFKEGIVEEMREHIEASCPEFAGKIHFLECSTPLTLRDFTNSPFGSMYGVKHRMDQYNPVHVTRVKSLFLAGQAIVAPGVLGTLVSAFLACGAILGHDRLRNELRKCS